MEISTIGRPYARAVFTHALEKGQLNSWAKVLSLLSFIIQDDRIKAVVSSPVFSKSEKSGIVCDIASSELDDAGKNLVKTMAVEERLLLLPEVNKQFDKMKALQENTKDVSVVSALPLSDDEVEQLKQKLSKKFGVTINISLDVDEAIIGGLIIKAEDFVIDGSIKGKVKRLAESLMS